MYRYHDNADACLVLNLLDAESPAVTAGVAFALPVETAGVHLDAEFSRAAETRGDAGAGDIALVATLATDPARIATNAA